jgi:outer membrane protein OmpA-like peptidoglycan-associated protein
MLRAAATLVATVFACKALGATPGTAAREHVPFVTGLTVTGVLNTFEGDYEPLLTIDDISTDKYRVTFASEVPNHARSGRRLISVSRTVPMRDHLSARTMRNHFFEGDREAFPGTTPFLSKAVVEDLRRGSAELTVLESESFLGVPIDQPWRGRLVRVASTTMTVLVNGSPTALPVIHARGDFENDGDSRQADVYVLDEPNNPLFLRWVERQFTSRIVRIEYPQVQRRAAGSNMEQELQAKRPIAVYGIYFAFGSATIRPQSERTLREIASVMLRHADWKLQLDGYTDSIGNDAANLDLSRRRSAAVKAALTSRHRIPADRLVTGGYGESGAADTNKTPEGRARNRRVVISRH